MSRGNNFSICFKFLYLTFTFGTLFIVPMAFVPLLLLWCFIEIILNMMFGKFIPRETPRPRRRRRRQHNTYIFIDPNNR